MILKTFQDQKSEILLAETSFADTQWCFWNLLFNANSNSIHPMEESRWQSSHYIKKQTMKTGVFPDEEERVKVRGRGSRFFFASTDPKQCLWIWDLHSLYCSESLTLARNMYWSQCEFFCYLWWTSVRFPKLGKPATQGIMFLKNQFHDYADETLFLTVTLYASGSPGFCWSRMDTNSFYLWFDSRS